HGGGRSRHTNRHRRSERSRWRRWRFIRRDRGKPPASGRPGSRRDGARARYRYPRALGRSVGGGAFVMMGIILVLVVTALVVFSVVVYTLKNLLLVSSPNEALILSGGAHEAEGKVLGYRSIRGGRAVRIPLLESVD